MTTMENPSANNHVETALGVLENSLTRQMDTYLNVCAHCGLCNDACHYFVAMGDPKMVPTYKTDRLRNVWRRKHEWMGRIFPKWVGAYDLTEDLLDEMIEISFRDCTLCGRCVVNCPFGVDTRAIIKTVRAMAVATGKEPEILTQLADAAISREENFDFFKDFFLEQIKEMETELQESTGDPEACIPIEKEGARVLYVPLSGKHTILPPAEIFHTAGESWTLSMFDASNYGVFTNDITRAKRITERIVNEAKRLGVDEVVITECGHAYSTMRWSAPNWFDEPFPFKVRSIIELIHEYIANGRIQVAQLEDMGAVTLHDPCNLGRAGGLFEEPRDVLKSMISDYREMTPNRENNFCCGGGGGLVANLDYEDERIAAGKPKADQIHATGADAVVASCDNCRHQIGELSEHYKLGVDVIGISEITVKAMHKARESVPAA
jgi:Fe-S oxidoreductase